MLQFLLHLHLTQWWFFIDIVLKDEVFLPSKSIASNYGCCFLSFAIQIKLSSKNERTLGPIFILWISFQSSQIYLSPEKLRKCFLFNFAKTLKFLNDEIYKYSRVRNKHSPTLINFLSFFQGLWSYSGLHRAYFSSITYKWGYACFFCQIF